MMIEMTITFLTFAALGLLPPTEKQRTRAERGLAGRPFGEQLAVLRRVGMHRG